MKRMIENIITGIHVDEIALVGPGPSAVDAPSDMLKIGWNRAIMAADVDYLVVFDINKMLLIGIENDLGTMDAVRRWHDVIFTKRPTLIIPMIHRDNVAKLEGLNYATFNSGHNFTMPGALCRVMGSGSIALNLAARCRPRVIRQWGVDFNGDAYCDGSEVGKTQSHNWQKLRAQWDGLILQLKKFFPAVEIVWGR